MAYIALNNKFTPYTFEELVKPFVMYDTAYQQAQARTDELLEKAAALEDLSPTVDKDTYDAYQEWKGQLKAISDQIAERGLDVNTRSAINTLGNTYRTDYLPTVAKLKTRGELIKGQREYLQKHPNAFFDIDYSTTPVSEVTGSSTYNTYDLDDITSKVMTDAYGKYANGETPNADDYMAQYGAGIDDPERQAQISRAISSGMSIASANNKQKELENYLKELQVKRSYARSSGGGGSGSGTSGYASAVNVTLPDNTTLQLKYNKNTKEYEYKDSNKQLRSIKLDENTTNEDIIRDYYGGYYSKLDVNGEPVRRVLSDDGYLVRTSKGWERLPRGGHTTYREYLNQTGRKIAMPTAPEMQDMTNTSLIGKNLERGLKRGNITTDFIYPDTFNDYAENPTVSPKLRNLIKKLDGLMEEGLLDPVNDGVAIRVYKDSAGNIIGYNTDAGWLDNLNTVLNSPIEQDWKENKRALDALKENGPLQ